MLEIVECFYCKYGGMLTIFLSKYHPPVSGRVGRTISAITRKNSAVVGVRQNIAFTFNIDTFIRFRIIAGGTHYLPACRGFLTLNAKQGINLKYFNRLSQEQITGFEITLILIKLTYSFPHLIFVFDGWS